MFIVSFPDNIDLLAFFESEPIFNNTEYFHFAYKKTDIHGMSVIFAFSATSGWIQAIIEFNGIEVSRYLMEGVESFKIVKDLKGEYISSEIEFEDTRTKVEIRVAPSISVEFATLVR